MIAEKDDEDALIDLMAILAALSMEAADAERKVSSGLNAAVADVNKIYNDALNDTYKDARFKKALKITSLSTAAKKDIEKHAQSVSRATAATIRAMAKGTNIPSAMREAVNRAYIAAQGHVGDYHGLMRSTVREIGRNGVLVRGEDGKYRRMVGAVMRVVRDGEQEIRQYTSDVISRELKFDAVEISVHENSAPDHEPVQGHVFTLAEFSKLQNAEPCVDIDGRHFPAMERAIGELNCRHITYGFSTEYSERRYTNEQLDAMARRNAEGCVVDGKSYTLYEAVQYWRKLENDRMRLRNILVAAEAAGDKMLAFECRVKVNALDRRIEVVRASVEVK